MKRVFIYTFLFFAFPDYAANAAFRLEMGSHEKQYFADRMVLKAKLVGFDHGVVKEIKQDPPLYRAYLDFESEAEAQAAAAKIKMKVPDASLRIRETK